MPDDAPMCIEVGEESFDTLVEYATIPIGFEVREILDRSTMLPRTAESTYVKDYDLDGNSPTDWPARFDLSGWGLLVARVDGSRVGGAAIAFDTPGMQLLDERRDAAVLWDLRVAPELRGRGVGTALFRAAERWAVAKHCQVLEVETQDINVPACRFYARMGCRLGAIDRAAYAEFAHEVQLIWHKRLTTG